MAQRDGQVSAGQGSAEGLEPGEREQLVYALETRFADHLEAAASEVRAAERELEEAREALASAERAETTRRYQSDPLVFMRASMAEEVDGLERKTTPKKLRASYRFLVDRAAELAAGEVQGYRNDREAAEHQRTRGLEACREAEQRAVANLEAAQAMQERVRVAEQSARDGLAVMVRKIEEAV
ncbi:MAG: hypothetical protein GX555_19065 [Actinomycetales bacterium]|nr:hypothetical protein [Actinomycetales bacterium]